MQDNEMVTTFRLCALAETLKLTKEAYLKTKDRRIAAAALVLTELALSEADAVGRSREATQDD